MLNLSCWQIFLKSRSFLFFLPCWNICSSWKWSMHRLPLLLTLLFKLCVIFILYYFFIRKCCPLNEYVLAEEKCGLCPEGKITQNSFLLGYQCSKEGNFVCESDSFSIQGDPFCHTEKSYITLASPNFPCMFKENYYNS
jgi:hypothetical protein